MMNFTITRSKISSSDDAASTKLSMLCDSGRATMTVGVEASSGQAFVESSRSGLKDAGRTSRGAWCCRIIMTEGSFCTVPSRRDSHKQLPRSISTFPQLFYSSPHLKHPPSFSVVACRPRAPTPTESPPLSL